MRTYSRRDGGQSEGFWVDGVTKSFLERLYGSRSSVKDESTEGTEK